MRCFLIFSKAVFTAELIVSYPKDGDYSRRSTKYTEKEAVQLLDTHNKENLQIQQSATVGLSWGTGWESHHGTQFWTVDSQKLKILKVPTDAKCFKYGEIKMGLGSG